MLGEKIKNCTYGDERNHLNKKKAANEYRRRQNNERMLLAQMLEEARAEMQATLLALEEHADEIEVSALQKISSQVSKRAKLD